MKKIQHTLKSGEVTIMLVLIILLLATLTTTAVALAISTTRDTTTMTLGERALTVAESGAENGVLRLLRDPSYTGEANLPIGPGSATIGVIGNTITSTGVVGNMVRTVQVTVGTVAGRLSVTGWQEL